VNTSISEDAAGYNFKAVNILDYVPRFSVMNTKYFEDVLFYDIYILKIV
jgi:hypothetical protein